MLHSAVPSPHRPFITFPQETQFTTSFNGESTIQSCLLSDSPYLSLSHTHTHTHIELGDGDLVAIERLFSQSFFILPTMLQTWLSALDEFKRNR